MRTALVSDARQEDVVRAVVDVLHERGALVSEHTSSRVRFHGYRPAGQWSWARAGYIGVYQPVGEKDVEVRMRLRARWPFRVLWTVALANVIASLAVIAWNPPGTIWFAVAFIEGFLLLSAGLLYLNTWTAVRREAADLMTSFESTLRALPGVASVATEAELSRAAFEAKVEGEIAQHRLDAARSPTQWKLPKLRIPLRPANSEAPSDDAAGEAVSPRAHDALPAGEADEKRRRLLARKAELEARRNEKGD